MFRANDVLEYNFPTFMQTRSKSLATGIFTWWENNGVQLLLYQKYIRDYQDTWNIGRVIQKHRQNGEYYGKDQGVSYVVWSMAKL